MRKGFLFVLPFLSCLMSGVSVANWQYGGTYVGDGAYTDDGTRFVISARGGAAMGRGTIKNKIGNLTPAYYMAEGGQPFPEILCGGKESCESSGYIFAGYANLGELSAAKDFDSFAFAAGASIGWTIPNRPQWRVELGWDHITESEYNASPLFEGDTYLFDGNFTESAVVSSGAVQSKITTDIISAMAFYDFFDGLQKPARTIIPYVGFGVGYADSKTAVNLSDPYGDLSGIYDLLPYGEPDENGVFSFYKSEANTSTVAGLVALGLSYGITDTMYLDLGARVAYIPKVKFALTNADDTRDRDWFDAENVIYANFMLGLRFEF